MPTERVEFVEEEQTRASVLSVFEELKTLLESILPAAAVEHIGATAIPGAVTKGDLDVCVLVEQNAFGEADRLLAAKFARNVGSDQTPSLSSFVDDSRAVPVGVQLVARGGAEDFFVRWRDLLRRSPKVLDEYNRLKRAWHGGSAEGYRSAKSKFIEETLRDNTLAG